MAENIEADDASWAEVRVSLIFTAATSAVFLSIFEIGRRNPSLSVVFDRRRNSKPHRTPPPLIRHSIFEWLFLSNEPRYSEYSDLSHMRDVILERKRQRDQQRKRQREKEKGFLSNLRAGKGDANDDADGDLDVDGDDQHDGLNAYRNVGRNADPGYLSPKNLGFYKDDSFSGSIDHSMIAVGKVNLEDSLYGVETNIASGRSNESSPSKKTKIQRHLTPNIVEINGRRLPKQVAEYALANDLTEDQLQEYENSLVDQEMTDEKEFEERVIGMKRRYNRSGSLLNLSNHRKNGRNVHGNDVEGQQGTKFPFSDGSIRDAKNRHDKLEMPNRPNRILYVNFQQGALIEKPTNPISPRARMLSPRSLYDRMKSWTSNHKSEASDAIMDSPRSAVVQAHREEDAGKYINRHLKTEHMNKRPLSQSDAELLRYIGLDTFVMIRFLRFCFDVTFYPFALSMMVLIPTYYTNDWDGFDGSDFDFSQVDGYFRFTINRLEDSSAKVWVPLGYTALFILFILRRHWIEWETFTKLHFDFMANGDVENEELQEKTEADGGSFKSRALTRPKDDVQLHLEQFRNSCIVECVPESHRRDRELFEFYNSVFPNQVKRAEIIINAFDLAGLIKQRQAYIERYESVYAKFQHAKQIYWRKRDGSLVETCSMMYCMACKCLDSEPRKPEDPTIAVGKSHILCCGSRKVKALPYLLSEIKRLNRDIDKEHKKITQSKNLAEDREEHRDIATGVKTFLTGTSQDLTCSTGFVEFTTLTAKQTALQCNLTGTNDYMVTESAPDPRDMLWENAAVETKFIQIKKLQCEALLFTGTLFWSVVVGTMTSISDLDIIKDRLPAAFVPEEDSFMYDLVKGYLPVVLLEILMLPVPFLIKMIATRFIRLKSHSEIDQFVYKWHFAYRVANLIIIVVRRQVLNTKDLVNDLVTDPQDTIYTLTNSIATSSQFFLNNMIIAAGTETLFELSQLHRIIAHFFLHQFITVEAASRRRLEKLQAPVSLEWGDVVPKFIFALLVAAVYSSLVPVVTGACAGFFYIATKVYTHQALFIYAQPYEGGGKLMYQLNRSIFSTVYTTITIFSVLLSLKKLSVAAVCFFLIMIIITILVDRQISKKFIKPGLTLSLTSARIIDGQNKLNADNKVKEESDRKAWKEHKKRQQKEAAEAAKDLHMKTYREVSSRLLNPRPPGQDIAENPVKVKRTRFQLNNHSSRKTINSFSEEEDEDEKVDFYLYRQPELNKILWETKPRPYLSSRAGN